ncbi:hypothetical protein C8R43DRAFT_1102287 [Mycena crocata]|nr:hypothetical protein C8R43DRAFT_1102287 [Mycena crocata]
MLLRLLVPPRLTTPTRSFPLPSNISCIRRGFASKHRVVAIPTGFYTLDVDYHHHVISPPPLGKEPWTGLLRSRSRNLQAKIEPIVCISLLGGLREKLQSLPSSPFHPHPISLKYVVGRSTITGAGSGVFASQNLAPAEVIWRERPLIMTGLDVDYGSVTKKIADLVPPMAKAQILQMHIDNCLPAPMKISSPSSFNSSSFVSHLNGVMTTNVVTMSILPLWEPQSLLLPIYSRMNHSCSPSVASFFDPYSLTVEFRAKRHIREGEEIFSSYTGEEWFSFAERQKTMQWRDFTCACRICSLPPEDRTKSDKNRAWLFSEAVTEAFDPDDDSVLLKWTRDAGLPEDHIIKPCQALWNTTEKEGIHPVLPTIAAAQRICKSYCALRNREGAIKWATLALEFSRIHLRDATHPAFQQWKKVIKNPERTDWWGRMVARKPRLV